MLATVQRILTMKRNDFVILDPKWFYTATSEKNERIKDEKKQEIRNALAVAHCPSPPILLALCNVNNNHYILLEANTQLRSMIHFDSVQNEARQMSDLKSLAGILDGEQSSSRPAYTYTIGRSAQQSDAINCGIFAIYNFICRMHGQQPLDKLDYTQLLQIRVYVFVMLYDTTYLLSVVQNIRNEQPELIDQTWFEVFTRQCNKRSVCLWVNVRQAGNS